MTFASGRSVSGATVDQEKGVGMDRWESKIAGLTKAEKDIGEDGGQVRSSDRSAQEASAERLSPPAYDADSVLKGVVPRDRHRPRTPLDALTC